MSIESFNKLVKLAARAFYDDVSTKGENNQQQPKNGSRSDNRGMSVVILDALTRRQWVREEDLAKDLKLHAKQLRRTLRFFEEEKLVTRDHRKETAKGAKLYSAAVAATGDGQHIGKEGEEKIKMHTHSYCCLDYAQIYDVLRYRLHRMKKKLKDELENRNTIQEYICPSCQRRYTAFDALQLVSPEDDSFRCESCRSELVAESDKFSAEELGDDENAKRRRREKLKDVLQKMEVQLKPLVDQLDRVKNLPVPDFGSLQAWEARVNAAARAANSDSGANDSSKSSQGQGYGGTPLPFFGETKVEVALSGVPVKEEDTKPDAGKDSMKTIPPWMIRQSMILTKEQRGEINQDLKMDSSSAAADRSDDRKSEVDQKDDEKSIHAEYIKAYYAAFLKNQQEKQAAKRNQLESIDLNNVSNGVSEISPDRRIGMKSKREEVDKDDDDVEWEEVPTGVSGKSKKPYILTDLNSTPPEESEDDEDEIEWEEG